MLWKLSNIRSEVEALRALAVGAVAIGIPFPQANEALLANIVRVVNRRAIVVADCDETPTAPAEFRGRVGVDCLELPHFEGEHLPASVRPHVYFRVPQSSNLRLTQILQLAPDGYLTLVVNRGFERNTFLREIARACRLTLRGAGMSKHDLLAGADSIAPYCLDLDLDAFERD